VGAREDDAAPGPEHAAYLPEHLTGVGDEREDSVCREHDVETRVTEREGQTVALCEGQRRPVVGEVDLSTAAEHSQREVGRHDPATGLTDPPSALGGSTPDLQDVAAGDIAQQPEQLLAPALGTPDQVVVTEEVSVLGVVVACLGVPPGPVGPSRLGHARIPAQGDGVGIHGVIVLDGSLRSGARPSPAGPMRSAISRTRR